MPVFGRGSANGSAFTHLKYFDQIYSCLNMHNRVLEGFELPQTNEAGELLASGTFTTEQTITGPLNIAAGGVVVFLDIATRPAAETLTLHLDVQDSVSSGWVTACSSSTYGAVDTYAWFVPCVLPRNWRLRVTPSAAGTWNASVGYSFTRDPGTGDVELGEVTANAGTNLNTSALALESGGNLAGAATSLAVIDDWDESDRAKVNPIAGQAGVQGGSGGVSALTQRVVLATDVGLPAGTNNIGDVDVLTIAAGDNNIGNVDIASFTSGAITEVQGDVAHDQPAAGNPVLLGGYVEDSADSAPGNRASAEADVARLVVNRDGALYTLQHPPQIWDYKLNSATQQTDTVIHAAPGANLALYITDIYCSAGGAVTITLQDEDNNYVWAYPAAASGDGATVSRTCPIRVTTNKALEVDTSAAVQVYVNVGGYIAP